jgi:hypothetical protein
MTREDALLDRAMKKCLKYCEENGYGFYAPSIGNSGCENHGGKEYVVLRDTTDILSVWLVGNGGELTLVEDHEDLPKSLRKEFRVNV